MMRLYMIAMLTAYAAIGVASDDRAYPPPADPAAARAELARYVTERLTDRDGRLVYPQRRDAMIAQLDDIIRLSRGNGIDERPIDPLLVVFIAYNESSFRPTVIGWKRGERGYMQVHGKRLTRGYDLSRKDHQWEVGIKRLRAAFDACGGDLCQSVTNFGTGRCFGHTERGKNKMITRCRRFIRLRKRYRGGR